MRAISIRQPYAELIMRGVKVDEFRSRATRLTERVWIYAALRPAADAAAWRQVKVARGELPTGVIVGSVQTAGCRAVRGEFASRPTHGSTDGRLGFVSKC